MLPEEQAGFLIIRESRPGARVTGLFLYPGNKGSYESPAVWAGYAYFQCAEQEKNGANTFPYMGWERDRACYLGGIRDIVMVAT